MLTFMVCLFALIGFDAGLPWYIALGIAGVLDINMS